MSKFKQEEKVVRKYEPVIYPQDELKSLERNLEENYKITKIFDNGKEGSFYNEEQYLKDVGALGPRGGVILEGSPTQYQVEKEKLDQLCRLQSKREYAIRMSNKDMEEQIAGMTNIMQI